MDKKKLINVRKKLDKLDYKILLLIKKRTLLVNNVIKLKKFKKQIVDKARIKEVLRKVKNHSIKKNIDIKITQKIWKSMINSYIDYEKRYFKKK
jgi:chorismate mutase